MHKLILDAVVIAKVKPAAGFIVSMIFGRKPLSFYHNFSSVQIIDHYPDVIKPADRIIAACPGRRSFRRRIKRDILRITADMYGVTTGYSRPLPADMSAKNFGHPSRGGFRVRYGEVCVF